MAPPLWKDPGLGGWLSVAMALDPEFGSVKNSGFIMVRRFFFSAHWPGGGGMTELPLFH